MKVKTIEIGRFGNAWTIEIVEEGSSYNDNQRYVYKNKRELLAAVTWALAQDDSPYIAPDIPPAPDEQSPTS